MKNEKEWIKLEEVAGKELTDALKTMYSLYDGSILDWFSEIYDPGTGGFYASIGGRDGRCFGPDIQCTTQAVRFMINTGVSRPYGEDCKKFIPENMQRRLIYFAKSLQDPDNGYFYHKQWGRAGTDSKLSRRGRDLGWATSLLSSLGSAPTYDTPNGIKGDGITADQYWDSLNTDEPRPYTYDCSPVEYIVDDERAEQCAKDEELFKAQLDKAISTAPAAASKDGDTTAYLKSHKGYMRYLLDRLEPFMHSNPYMMGNESGSGINELKRYSELLGPYAYTEGDDERYKRFDGMKMSEMLLSVLTDCINPKTGIWGDLTDDAPLGCEFRYINGFFKTVGRYSDFGRCYPTEYIAKAAEQIMACLLGDEPSTANVCEIFNIWSCVHFLKQNLALCPDESVRESVGARIDEILKKNAPAAVLNTYKKLLGYKKPEGGMAHNYYRGTTAHQCLPVSPDRNISDVDGTCCGCSGALRNMFLALELGDYRPPVFSEDEARAFLRTLAEKEPITKKVYISKNT